MNWSSLFATINVMSKYSTVIGRIWLSVIFIFRMLVLVVAAQSVWRDEQSDFQCNTLQPGCKNVCFDHFFPILHVRLWALQLIFVATPTMLVVMHISSRYRREKKKGKFISYWEKHNQNAAKNISSRETTNSENCTQNVIPSEIEKPKGGLADCSKKRFAKLNGGLFYTYILSIMCRIGLEVSFLYAFYALYSTYHMPRLLECQVSPCPQVVECFVARPTEKTIFTVFMLSASVICLLLNITEVLYLTIKRCLHTKVVDRTQGQLTSTPHTSMHKFI
uniref:gap junction beta-2 protein-like n=1 Tax=Myxine glutinosa TaxID=7769 RepID=UPI00358E6F71